MDLFTKRCGCGAIYRPAVATSRACATCEARVYSERRQAAVVARSGEIRPPAPAKTLPLGRPMDPVAKGGNPAPYVNVNGVEIPVATPYGPRHPVQWRQEYQAVFDDRVHGGLGASRKVPTYAAATIQSIIEEIDHAVRKRIEPYMFESMTRQTCDQIVAIVEQTLESVLPVTVAGRVVEYGSARDSFSVRARLWQRPGSAPYDLTWTFR